MPKLYCYSYERFGKTLKDNGWNNFNLPSDWAFIEIGEYKPCESEPQWLMDCENVIGLNFDDISGYRVWEAIPGHEWTSEEKERYKDVYGMSKEDAKRLFKFIDKHIGKNIMLHCSAGISRSQGVVRFILDTYPEIYNEDDTNKDNPCILPNLCVTSMLKKEYYKQFISNFY